MVATERSGVVSFAETAALAPGPNGKRNVLVLKRGTLDVKLVNADPPNVQTPHVQDELYIIIRGKGVLVHEGRRSPFDTGDLLFVAAGVEHHYADFSDDLALWRVFYGREGGESVGA